MGKGETGADGPREGQQLDERQPEHEKAALYGYCDLLGVFVSELVVLAAYGSVGGACQVAHIGETLYNLTSIFCKCLGAVARGQFRLTGMTMRYCRRARRVCRHSQWTSQGQDRETKGGSARDLP